MRKGNLDYYWLMAYQNLITIKIVINKIILIIKTRLMLLKNRRSKNLF